MATTTVLLRDLEAGSVPRICVKTGLPADVIGRFVFGKPSKFSWVSGTCGCACLIVLGLPLTVLLVPILGLGALVARHSQGVFALPMTSSARRRLWVGRWGGWVLLAVSTGVLVLVLSVFNVARTDSYAFAVDVTFAVAALAWFIAAGWAVLVTAAYLQPGGGVPLVGVTGLTRQDTSRGPFVELRGVHQHFADAVYSQYHPVDGSGIVPLP